MSLDELPAGLAAADVVVCAQGGGRPVVSAEAMADAIKARRHRPVLLIDVAVPADVEPAVDRLADVFRYELDDLERAAMHGRSTRAAAANAAWGLIDEAVAGYLGRGAESLALPSPALRRFEALRAEVLAQRPADAAAATGLMVDRLRRQVAAGLEGMAPDERAAAERLLAQLFEAAPPQDKRNR
jgi:glutamyl-tRNA reductase